MCLIKLWKKVLWGDKIPLQSTFLLYRWVKIFYFYKQTVNSPTPNLGDVPLGRALRVASDTRKVFASETQQRLFEGAVSINAKALTRGGKSPYLFIIIFKTKIRCSTPMTFSLFQSSSSLTLSFSFSFVRCAAHSVASSFLCAALSLLNERFMLGMTTSNKRWGSGVVQDFIIYGR